MKVEVIKGVSHSIELIHGETSVCITPDEAENLIAQLRAVVPVPEDVQEAAEKYNEMMSWAWEAPNHPHKAAFIAGAEWERNKTIPADVQEAADWYIGHRAEVGEDSETFAKRKAFADGMLAERWRVNRKAEVPEDYDPKYDKEALDAANEYVKGKQNLTYGAFRLMRPAFADGWMEHKERLMKNGIIINGRKYESIQTDGMCFPGHFACSKCAFLGRNNRCIVHGTPCKTFSLGRTIAYFVEKKEEKK